jgi:hypothetical protein
VLHHCRKRDRSVEPGHREDHVVVDRKGNEAEFRGSFRVGDEVIERERLPPEIHQRKMSPELHLVPLDVAKPRLTPGDNQHRLP